MFFVTYSAAASPRVGLFEDKKQVHRLVLSDVLPLTYLTQSPGLKSESFKVSGSQGLEVSRILCVQVYRSPGLQISRFWGMKASRSQGLRVSMSQCLRVSRYQYLLTLMTLLGQSDRKMSGCNWSNLKTCQQPHPHVCNPVEVD